MILVSVIMPAFNAAKYIQEAINSILAQTFEAFELIIIDDGSTDDTLSIIKQNQARDQRIIVLSQENKKQAAARNAGLKIAKGEWIAFIDADDIWLPTKLETQLKLANKADVVYTGGITYNETNGVQTIYPSSVGYFSGPEMYSKLYAENSVPNLSVMFRQKWIDIIGFQNESITAWGCEDWDYWLKLAKNGATFLGLENELFKYRVHAEGTSSNKSRMLLAEFFILLDNADYNLIPKNLVFQRLSNLLKSNFMLLLHEQKIKEIKQMLKNLLQLEYHLRYALTLFLLKLNVKLINQKIHYILFK